MKLWLKFNSVPESHPGNQSRMLIAMRFGLPLGVASHAGFFLAFWALGFPILALFNIFSTIVFVIGTLRVFKNDISWAIFVCILFEVPLHAILATLYLGFESGFWLLIFISVCCAVLSPTFPRFVRILLGLGITLLVGMAALAAISNGPIYIFSTELRAFFLLMNIVILALVVMVVIVSYDVAVERAETAQQAEYERAEALLLNVLPPAIAERLKSQEEPLADAHTNVTVLFADIAGFTPWSRTLSAERLVSSLNILFTRFDSAIEYFGAEKIKTIGDAYMVATGLNGEANHAESMAQLALEMQKELLQFSQHHNLDLSLRIGIHSGSVVAGVIGKHKFSYDLWGDTVNIASRMESAGIAGHIQISTETRNLLPSLFDTWPRGKIDIKGHDSRECFLLTRAGDIPEKSALFSKPTSQEV